jgi:Fe-S cluster assembly iron-binding protein IscA
MLTLTDQAVDVVRGLTQSPEAPDHAGLRLAPGEQGLELSVVASAAPGDDVIETGGVQVFVEQQASELLDERTLDASVQDGQVSFFLAAPPAEPTPAP